MRVFNGCGKARDYTHIDSSKIRAFFFTVVATKLIKCLASRSPAIVKYF